MKKKKKPAKKRAKLIVVKDPSGIEINNPKPRESLKKYVKRKTGVDINRLR